MVAFSSKYFACCVAAFFACLVGTVEGAPWPPHARYSTHGIRTIGKRGLQVETYHPKSTFKTYGPNGLSFGSSTSGGSSFASADRPGTKPWALNESSLSFIQSELGIKQEKMKYKAGYTGTVAKFAYVKQYHEGVPFANAVANVAYNNDNNIISFGSSFVNASKIAPSTPSLSWKSVLPRIEDSLGGKHNGHPPSLEYLVRPDGSAHLTHVVQVQNHKDGSWYEAFACAHTGKLLSVTDFVAHASYNVLPIQKQVFTEGAETLLNPQDLVTSPFGWHSDGVENTTDTSGNNVFAFKALTEDNLIPANQTSPGLNFLYKYDDSLDPTHPSNKNAARVNGFYIANTIHDIAYRYGFTEAAFNFQFSNGGKGGKHAKDQDGVLLSIQDASGTNNANFATPPDGQPGVCRMFIWDLTKPRRDGAMENDIVVHELTHGITNRMTGGGTGRCLQATEAAGMGEGWSDAMAEWVRQKNGTVRDFVMGQYVSGHPKGIRSYPYSTDPKVNPLRYSSVKGLSEPHIIGEVWANMLHNVYANLVQARGFSSTALTNPNGQEGNVVFMHLFMDSLPLQPCNPTFVSARDAWIQADHNRYNGANKCTIFKAFASRGLGVRAKHFVDDETLPAGC
ncbi:hypothetical protein AX17_002402 [Amanita inopinata Kibby_2008]|nr:hypothetical protein AX17_002402 [Amanita inopinata Kibby_2008]